MLAYGGSQQEDVDDPSVTYKRREIIRSKHFLNAIYREWYGLQVAQLPTVRGRILEIGSGAGFFDEMYPQVISSEVFFCPFVDVILNGMVLPFPIASLQAVVMTDVFHHIPDVEHFLWEAVRTLTPGGRIIMIEPWVSDWSRWVMDHFHSEPMDTEMHTWQFPSTGPLSGSNQALPWIVFKRDRKRFESAFPDLEIVKIQPFMPFRYLLSGGVSSRAMAPAWLNGCLRQFEKSFKSEKWAMFALIVIQKRRV
ncbi:MAG TPA: methyltransferase type 11 [Anaerolineaceae bacterium]|nr:methyltransferase type 11 [Anaerolineaceae bacterium]